MDLDLSDDQQLFCDTTRKFLTARWPSAAVRALLDDPVCFDGDVWAQGAELGWTSMLIDEEHGGGSISGQGVHDLGIVAEELGRHLVAGPVLPTNVVAAALGRTATAAAKEHLPGIAAGTTRAVWVVGGVDATVTPSGYRLRGTAAPVQDAHLADLMLVTADTGNGPCQLLVPSGVRGVSVTVLSGLDLTRRYCRVDLDDVEVDADAALVTAGPAEAALDYQLALALALQCAETLGATSAVREMTLEYVKQRKAFGRPIGSYQALKHRLAEMLLWIESAAAATSGAIAAVQAEQGALAAARLAKAYVADRCPVIVRDCLQMHGGIGYTWEHDLHLFLRRVETNAAIYGGVDDQLDGLATVVGL